LAIDPNGARDPSGAQTQRTQGKSGETDEEQGSARICAEITHSCELIRRLMSAVLFPPVNAAALLVVQLLSGFSSTTLSPSESLLA
jgi:hypothetical protein